MTALYVPRQVTTEQCPGSDATCRCLAHANPPTSPITSNVTLTADPTAVHPEPRRERRLTRSTCMCLFRAGAGAV